MPGLETVIAGMGLVRRRDEVVGGERTLADRPSPVQTTSKWREHTWERGRPVRIRHGLVDLWRKFERQFLSDLV